MSNPPSLSYSAAASRNVHIKSDPPSRNAISQRTEDTNAHAESAPPPPPPPPPQTLPRAPSPSHIPQTGSEEETLYVLTLLTDKPHHDRMTALRRRYFPPRINKLAAHLTLFHALPGSRLESNILPAIREVASRTSKFDVYADNPFRLKRGVAVNVAARAGGSQGKRVHQKLQDAWRGEGFLSEQDAGGCRLHYTLMNKVDDEVEVDDAFQDLTASFRGDRGVAEGLALWRYDRGFWRWERKFEFTAI